MKILNYFAAFTLLFPFFVVFTASADEDFTKKYRKEFKSDSHTEVDIFNKFGDVNITDWDKNMVAIEVVVSVEADDKEEANEYFERIAITLEKSGNTVKGKTEILRGFSNVSFSIDYKINMPKNLRLKLMNKYGNVFINELSNKIDVAVKYGSLKANKLSYGNETTKSEISLAYCKGSAIEKCSFLKLNLAYSKLEIEESNALTLETKYSKFYLEKANSVLTSSKYDTYRIGEIDKFKTFEAKYSEYEIRQLSSTIEAEIKYSEIEVDKIPAGFDVIDIRMAYGKINLNIDTEASYMLDAYTKYGKIDYPSGNKLNRQKENAILKVWGNVGSESNPKSKVKLRGSYGKIYLD
ncbi:MAG: hypothetical protein CSA05_02775 [Bacteroidia bacterium]|nr:MAG: hypothetical protein CSA05_02775 [Bacteroidia bacterium]